VWARRTGGAFRALTPPRSLGGCLWSAACPDEANRLFGWIAGEVLDAAEQLRDQLGQLEQPTRELLITPASACEPPY
jgi:hypothetical protein